MNTGPGPLAVLMLFAGGMVAMAMAIIAAKAAARRAMRRKSDER